ncbi:hypothetical protein [Alteraurantiacibacter palmitatis]|uniref:Uncharacterized protein n=1 Tax=Alteraurantiacibacter palmitatis TaxID=2054628 RepID=A0ABV7E8J0_9SPHN
MSALIAALILAQFPAGEAAELRLEGRCIYPDELARQAGTAQLVTCGEAMLNGQGIAFAARGFVPNLRFIGSWNGSELQLTHVARRGQRAADEARGSCRLEFRQNEISAIVCTAVAGPRSYIANFIVPDI